MPHYADGTLARVGDRVRGASYNRGGFVEDGVIVKITDGTSETCNLLVGFGGYHQTADGKFMGPAIDYGEARAFKKITDEPLARGGEIASGGVM